MTLYHVSVVFFIFILGSDKRYVSTNSSFPFYRHLNDIVIRRRPAIIPSDYGPYYGALDILYVDYTCVPSVWPPVGLSAYGISTESFSYPVFSDTYFDE